jgi:DNA-binding response OmpR family regulator
VSRVLVADDDRDIRDLVVFKLTQAGHEVFAAGDGQEALDLLRAEAPDIAVLDVMMPALSGLDICRIARSEPSTATLPVILLTAKVQEADVETGFAVGADDYVAKPFSPRELVNRVQAVLARSAA